MFYLFAEPFSEAREVFVLSLFYLDLRVRYIVLVPPHKVPVCASHLHRSSSAESTLNDTCTASLPELGINNTQCKLEPYFYYRNHYLDGCSDYCTEPGRYWCATEVDAERWNTVTKWAFCSPTCPRDHFRQDHSFSAAWQCNCYVHRRGGQRVECIFPYRDGNMEYWLYT